MPFRSTAQAPVKQGRGWWGTDPSAGGQKNNSPESQTHLFVSLNPKNIGVIIFLFQMKHLRLKVMYSVGWWNLLMPIAHSDEPSQRILPGFSRHLQMVSSLPYVRMCPNVATQIKQSKAIYSKLAISRKQISINWIWQRLKTVRRMEQLYSEKKEDVGYALIRDCWQGNAIMG